MKVPPLSTVRLGLATGIVSIISLFGGAAHATCTEKIVNSPVASSSLMSQIDGFGRATTGGLGQDTNADSTPDIGIVYYVTCLTDDADDPDPGSLRYGVEELTGPRWIVFDPALLEANTDPAAIQGLSVYLERYLYIDEDHGDLTIDGRAGILDVSNPKKAGKVRIHRKYYWDDYEVIDTTNYDCTYIGAGSDPRGIIQIKGAQNIIISHVDFQQHEYEMQHLAWDPPGSETERQERAAPLLGGGALTHVEPDCLNDQIMIYNSYNSNQANWLDDSGNPIDVDPSGAVENAQRSKLDRSNSYDRIWINHSTFSKCGDECISITYPSPAVEARVSITNNKIVFDDVLAEDDTPVPTKGKGILLGHTTTATKDYDAKYHNVTRNKLYVSMIRNHFEDVRQRLPRIDGATAHIVNNLFERSLIANIDLRDDANVVVEHNVFYNYDGLTVMNDIEYTGSFNLIAANDNVYTTTGTGFTKYTDTGPTVNPEEMPVLYNSAVFNDATDEIEPDMASVIDISGAANHTAAINLLNSSGADPFGWDDVTNDIWTNYPYTP